jgi:uncharacterized protein (PEP-CTERM system associated)
VTRLGSAVVVAVAVLVAFGTPVWALDLSEWVPGLRLSPFVSQRLEYETNVFQTPNNEEDDFISKTIPGFVVDYVAGPHSVSLGYRAEILRYFTLEDQDTVHHIGAFQLRLDFPRTLITLKDDYTHTSDPPISELTGRVESITNVLAPAVEYRFTPRLSAAVNYGWTAVDFQQDDLNDLDRDEHEFGITAYWKVLPRADIGLGYGYGFTNFDTAFDRDYDTHSVNLFLRGDITPKLGSTLRFGYDWRVGRHRSDADYSGWVMGGGLDYRATEALSFSLTVDRSTQESTFGDSAIYVTTGGALSASYQRGKLALNARVGGGYNDYPTKQTVGAQTDWREDLYYAAGAGIDYDIQRWLRVGLEYLFTGRDSNFQLFDFADHRVGVKATVQF